MTTIHLPKAHYKFLQCAMSVDPEKTHLHLVMVTDHQTLLTTDGFRMHIIPQETQHEPGYYSYVAAREELIQMDSAAIGKEFYKKANLLPDKAMYGAEYQTPMFMISASGTKVLMHLDFPTVKRNITKHSSDHSLLFRRAKMGGADYAFCLGLDACPIEVDELGNAHMVSMAGLLMLDALFVQEFLKNGAGLVRPVIRWTDVREGMRPALLGDREDAHAIIMPMHNKFWDLKGEFRTLEELEYA